MNLALPPDRQPAGTPVVETLEAGTRLVRVHGDHPADAFNPTPQPSRLRGGRFDSLDGDWASTYLGEDGRAAVAETLCRDLPVGGAARLVPRSRLVGRRISTVEVVRDLPVLVLHGAALTQVGAPLELTKSSAGEYLTTRAWARALRLWLPDVAGFRYRCRHDEDLLAHVLFDDGPDAATPRARGALQVVPESTLSLETVAGLALVMEVLRAHNATLA
ncbi:RES family NAD+ phosphorylase [Pseudokineococcus marinus]|uniref:RES family NAD+ phosphorylase n=1 Tax=Pseudokineococcus marinus TaxID=351215 RepID=A0A849BKC9_9ACTN|nr:RES family NAD+ phosphorylase [Pseudokineococcus marinus]NNH21547.1 RES family NAD+ phosphorylase [Pseudokineococcus marinus]